MEELQQRAARARDSAVETLNDEKSALRSAETGQPKNPAAASMQGSNGESGGAATKGHSETFGANNHACMGWRVSRCSGMISSDVIAVASPVKADDSDSAIVVVAAPAVAVAVVLLLPMEPMEPGGEMSKK